MKLKSFLTSLVLCLSFLCKAQQIQFARTYLNYGTHYSYGFTELPDSGYIIVGSSRTSNILPQYSFAMCINKFGDTLWTKNYLPNSDEIYGIVLIDSTSCMVTSGFYHLGGSAITIAKINLNGDTIFTREYGYPSTGRSGDICKTPDGGYITNNMVSLDYGFIKLDSNANEEWHTWQNMQIGCAEIKPDNDNGYVAVGGRYDNFKPYEVARLDSSGGIIWQYEYGNTPSVSGDEVYALDVVVMPDSNYLVGTNGPDWQLMKIDRNTGDTLWTKNYDTITNYRYIVNCMDYAQNDRYIIGTPRYMMLIDSNGDSIWKKPNPFITDSTSAALDDVHKTLDGGYFVTLNTPGYIAIAFVKLDSLGNTIFTSVFNPSHNFQPLSFYPNPATNELFINPGSMAAEKKLLFTLIDLQGRTILQQQYNATIPVDVSAVPQGLYIAVLKGKEKEVRGKVVIQR